MEKGSGGKESKLITCRTDRLQSSYLKLSKRRILSWYAAFLCSVQSEIPPSPGLLNFEEAGFLIDHNELAC